MRPLRGGQGTFDRLIENIRSVAGRDQHRHRRQLRRELGGQLSGLIDFLQRAGLRRQAGQRQLQADRAERETPQGLGAPGGEGDAAAHPGRRERQAAERHLHVERRRRAAASGATAATFSTTRCRCCGKRPSGTGFYTPDGVHGGPCHVHHTHAHTIGPDGSLYACPGFTGEKALSTGHIDGRRDADAGKPRSNSSSGSTPGTSARTVRLSPRVQGDVWSHRTLSLAT